MQLGLETLLFHAVEITDSEARDAYLRQVCGSDTAKLAELQSMVRDYLAAGSYLDRAATVPPTLAADAHHSLGLQIGPYRLRELLGEGGMGCVYVAEQQVPVRRKVALKIIKPGMDSRQVIARFESERQALALMDHPHIAKVLDAGTTEQGLPYFVMELVKGAPITEYCDQHKLTTRQRLELVIQVCQAVQHAHQKGIIHRDLKPSNVMVTVHDVTPVVKVIDFGVAKAIGRQLSDQTLYTAVNQLIGTPLYMSPEQAGQSGLDIDTRSDVYSLGVLLYELLTGTTPFDKASLQQAGYDEFRRLVREVEPAKPSQRVSTLKAEAQSTIANNRQLEPHKLSRELRGELDWIVMKAIDKDRERRYESALSFASDLQRFLDDLPVEASPPSFLYLLSKSARRHRVVLTTSAALVCMMIATTALSTRYAFITDRALADSERNRKTADAQRAIAEMRQKESDRLQLEAIAQRNTTQQALYKSDIRLASLDHTNVNPLRLQKTLDTHVPVGDAPDLRAWEWYYLLGASHQDTAETNHRREVVNVAWSPDGKHIASTGLDGIRIRDASLEKLIYENSSGRESSGGTWSPDSRCFAWAELKLNNDNVISIWDSLSGEVTILPGYASSIREICWSPDGQRLVSASLDQSCRVWDPKTEECLLVIRDEASSFVDVCWNSKRDLAASCLQDGVLVFNPVTGEVVTKTISGRPVHSVQFSADGTRMIVGDSAGRCFVYSVDDWKVLLNFQAHNNELLGIAANPKFPSFATCGADGVTHIWRLVDGGRHSTLFGHNGAVNDVDWDPSGLLLVTGSSDQRVLTWGVLESPTFHRIALGNSEATTISWAADSSRITCTTEDRRIATIDTTSRKVVTSPLLDGLAESDHPLKSATMTKYMDAGTDDRFFKNKQFCFDTYNQGILWSGDDSKVVVVKPWGKAVQFRNLKREVFERGRFLEIWKAREKVEAFSTFLFSVSDAQWAPDHRRLVVGGSGDPSRIAELDNAGWVYVFDAEEGKQLHKLRHGTLREQVTAVGWHPNGTQIVAGNMTGLCCVWDAADGKLNRSLPIHQAQITGLTWSPDAKRIASADNRGQVKILDAETLEELLTLSEGTGGVKQLAWSPDGQHLAGIHSSGNVIVWSASRGYAYCNSDSFQRRLTSRNSAALLVEAEFHREKDDSESAIQILDQILQADRENLQALMNRGALFYETARFSLALADFKRVSDLVAKHQTALFWMGKAQIRLGLFDDAIASLTASCDASPETSDIPRSELAEAYILRGDLEQALSELYPLFDKLPIENAGKTLAALYISRGDTNSYAELCKRVLDYIQREKTTSYEILQGCYICSQAPNAFQDYQALLSVVQKIESGNARLTWFNFNLGAAYFRAGKLEEALQYLKQASNKADEGASQVLVHYFLALTHLARGQQELAHESLAMARSLAQEESDKEGPPEWNWQILLDSLEAEAMNLLSAP